MKTEYSSANFLKFMRAFSYIPIKVEVIIESLNIFIGVFVRFYLL